MGAPLYHIPGQQAPSPGAPADAHAAAAGGTAERTVAEVLAKSQAGAGNKLPHNGTVFLSLADRDKDAGSVAALRFFELGFSIAATTRLRF